jgi:glucose-6-phosphate-specific signal transduction histidine kinase
MIFRFFDYVFYRAYKGYSGTSETAPEGSAVAILSLLQGLNILTVSFLYELITHNRIHVHKYWVGVLMLVIMVFNYFRYIKKDYFEVVKKRCINESIQQEAIVWIYIIFSIVGCVGLAIYLGETRS